MKNMKQLVALVLGLIVGSQLHADKAAALSAVWSDNSHFCKCNNNSLESISCASQCPKSGWSGKSYLTTNGVMCICKDGSKEEAACERLARCSSVAGSGFAGEVYSLETGKLEKVPDYDKVWAPKVARYKAKKAEALRKIEAAGADAE